MVVIEFDVSRSPEPEVDIGAVADRALAVVFGPAVVQGGLVLPSPRGDIENPLPYIVFGIEAEVGIGAIRLPVPWAAELALQAANRYLANGEGD